MNFLNQLNLVKAALKVGVRKSINTSYYKLALFTNVVNDSNVVYDTPIKVVYDLTVTNGHITNLECRVYHSFNKSYGNSKIIETINVDGLLDYINNLIENHVNKHTTFMHNVYYNY